MDHHDGPAPDASAEAARDSAGSAADRRAVIVLAHLFAAVSAFSVWAAADAWQAVTRLPAAGVLSVLAALPAGFVFATLVHEWGHFTGARVSGARYTVPARVGLYAFDYDFGANSVPQFLAMSWGGQAGGVVAVLLLVVALPLDTAGRCMVVASAVGSFFFAGMIEWPVIARVRRSGNPLGELSRIDRGVIRRSAATGAVAVAAAWFVLAF